MGFGISCKLSLKETIPQGDNLYEISNPVFRENKKNVINLPSAESAQRVVKVKMPTCMLLNVQINADLFKLGLVKVF